MIKESEIIKVVLHHNRGLFVFAKHLGTDHNLIIGEKSILGEIPVYQDFREIHDNEDNLRPEIFVFRPSLMEHLFYKEFNEGQLVTLEILD